MFSMKNIVNGYFVENQNNPLKMWVAVDIHFPSFSNHHQNILTIVYEGKLNNSYLDA